MAETLTLDDVAMLYDGIREDLPKGLSDRLARMVRSDRRFADQVRRLETMARDAGLEPGAENRMTTARALAADLERLLAAEDWRHPADVLDPSGELGVDLRGLARLAGSVARRPDPPEGIERVRAAVAGALEAEAAEEALVETFVQGLAARPERAPAILRDIVRRLEASSAVQE